MPVPTRSRTSSPTSRRRYSPPRQANSRARRKKRFFNPKLGGGLRNTGPDSISGGVKKSPGSATRRKEPAFTVPAESRRVVRRKPGASSGPVDPASQLTRTPRTVTPEMKAAQDAKNAELAKNPPPAPKTPSPRRRRRQASGPGYIDNTIGSPTFGDGGARRLPRKRSRTGGFKNTFDKDRPTTFRKGESRVAASDTAGGTRRRLSDVMAERAGNMGIRRKKRGSRTRRVR